jgi:cytochrome c-type biogenesis protein
VIPLIPAYVSFMTGMSLAELKDKDRPVGKILGPVLLFVLGFTIVFVAMGASASALGSFVSSYKDVLTKIAGAVIVVFGVILLDVIPLPWLHMGGIDAAGVRRFGPWAALAFGMAFPFAIGACAGPVYGAILTLALGTQSVGAGASLLLVYSFGLAVPFVAVSLLLERLVGTLGWLARHARTINRVAGVVLILMGLAMMTGLIEQAGSLLRTIPGLGSIG